MVFILAICIVLHFSKDAYATGEPVVNTGTAVSGITSSSADVNGTVTNSSGLPYTAWMEYGTNTNATGFLTTTAPGSAIPSAPALFMDSSLSGLSASTTYYYAICAQSTNGTACGTPSSFTTLANAGNNGNVGNIGNGTNGAIIGNDTNNIDDGSNTGGAPGNTVSSNITNVLTYNATDLTDTSVKFNGSGTIVNGATDYAYFRYSDTAIPPIFCNDIYGSGMSSVTSTTPNSDGSTPTDGSFSGSGNFSAGVNNLAPNTTYYYCAVISNNAIANPHASNFNFTPQPTDIQYGGVKSFTTECGTTCTTVTTTPATSITDTTATINGSYNSTQNVTTWLEYAAVPPPPGPPTYAVQTPSWQQLNIQSQSATTGNPSATGIEAPVTGLTSNTQYMFRAVAQVNWGTAANPNLQPPYYGTMMYFTTNPPDSSPSTPTDPGSGPGDDGGGYDGGGGDTYQNPCQNLTINPINNQTVQAGSSVSFGVTTCGANGETVTYSQTGAPNGSSFNPNGLFFWTTHPTDAGTSYTITINASTPDQTTATPITVTIAVTPIITSTTCPTLTIDPIPDQNYIVGQNGSFTATVCGNNGAPVTYTIAPLPADSATYNPQSAGNSALVVWIPAADEAGQEYDVIINATAPGQTAVPVTVHITVTASNNGPTGALTVCPVGSTGTYPNCVNQATNTCAVGFIGTPPNCTVNNNQPTVCPVNSTGTYPNCLNNTNNTGFCAGNATGSYPNCVVNTTGFTGNTNGNGTFGGGTFGNGNGGNGTNGNNGPTVLGSANNPAPALGTALVPPSMDVVRYHEGVENVFIRQIMGDPALAQIYGYQDGQNLLVFAQNLAHTFATMFGYYHGGGREIRVITPDIAAYQLGLDNGMLAVYEYYDNHLTGVATVTTTLNDRLDYEYYFQ